MRSISLTIPAQSDFVHVARTVAASVGAALDFSYDDIDDLRLAVDEACAYLLSIGPSATAIHLSISLDGSRVLFEAAMDLANGAGPEPEPKHPLLWHILGALTEDARFDRTDRGPSITFAKRASSA